MTEELWVKNAKERGLLVDIDDWNTVATLYSDKEVGSARIVHSKYKKGFYHNYGVNGYELFRVTNPIVITELQIREKGIWKTWMVDDPPHWWSMKNYAKRSSGNVLVAGLGLGLIEYWLCKNVDVSSVSVIEINEDVIKLITSLLKFEDCDISIIKDDFYDFINKTDKKFDRIIIDLWVTGSAEETEKVLRDEITPLSYYIKKLFPDASVVFHGFGLEW